MTILYTSGNKNLSTVRLVAKAVKDQLQNENDQPVRRIVLFNSPGVNSTQTQIYRDIFGSVPIDDILLQVEGLGDSQVFTEAFRLEGLKHIDLTNGQKTTAAQLYLAASLLGLDRIFYLSLKKASDQLPKNPVLGQDYTYIKIPIFSPISSLAKLSYFDLIYYLKEIESIFDGVEQDGFLSRTKRDLCKAVTTFFQEDSFRSAISDATTFVENTIIQLLSFLREYPTAKKFSSSHSIDFRQKDPLGAITYFFRQYSEHSGGDLNLDRLVAVPGLLSALRSFRNLSAHSGRISRDFQANEARVTINMAIECLRCLQSSSAVWKLFRRV
jgi:hypothetical protein